MPQEYTKEEFWKLYEKLPQELQEAIFSGETAEHISNICGRYNVNEKTISEVAKQVGNVLLGILPLEEFQKALVEELKIEEDTAEKMAHEINRFIFYPVKPALEQFYKTGGILAEEGIGEPTAEKTERKPAKGDAYKEPIE